MRLLCCFADQLCSCRLSDICVSLQIAVLRVEIFLLYMPAVLNLKNQFYSFAQRSSLYSECGDLITVMSVYACLKSHVTN